MPIQRTVLTNRRYGVSTIWLVATLGPKSTTKRLSKKELQRVNVPKACDTIMQPEAPMALRLQSNLLYGVSRVYSRQCDFVLSDAQVAQNQLRQLLSTVRFEGLDEGAGRVR
jgi:meiotic recombination protein REC8